MVGAGAVEATAGTVVEATAGTVVGGAVAVKQI
jgi:hypothetical protein